MRQFLRNQKELSQTAKHVKEEEQAWQMVRHDLINTTYETASEIVKLKQEALNERANIEKYNFN